MNSTTLDALKKGTANAWDELLATVGRDEDTPLDPELAGDLLDSESFDHWLEVVERRLDRTELFSTMNRPRANFIRWFANSAGEALDTDDERLWPVRMKAIAHAPEEDGGYAEASELYESMEAAASGAQMAEIAMLVAKGAKSVGEYAEAADYARRAHSRYEERGDDAAVEALRRLGGAQICMGEYRAAIETLREPMRQRRWIFSGSTVFRPISDPLEAARNEAATVAMWASTTTPEWVRCLGALAEREEDAKSREFLSSLFRMNLRLMLHQSQHPGEDTEVVVRQASQRSLVDIPVQALELYLDRFPDDEWARGELERRRDE